MSTTFVGVPLFRADKPDIGIRGINNTSHKKIGPGQIWGAARTSSRVPAAGTIHVSNTTQGQGRKAVLCLLFLSIAWRLPGAKAAMITPLFKATQDDTHVVLVVRTPHVKADELDLEVSRSVFKMYIRPYFLSLTFKQPLAEDGKETANWDVGKGEMTIRLPKENPGQDFDNLNMLTDLLTKPKKSNPPPVGAGLVSEVMEEGAVGVEGEEGEDEDYNWEMTQQLPKDDPADELLKKVSYGFNNMYSGVFKDRQEFETEILDVKGPDRTPASERRRMRQDEEDAKMEEEHGQYLFDTILNLEAIEPVIKYKAPWERLAEQANGKLSQSSKRTETASSWGGGGTFGDEPTLEKDIDYAALDEEEEERGCGWDFTHAERDALLKLPRRTYILDHEEKKKALVGLVDILYGHCYDVRTTENDPTCESAWTVCKLSSTLSWLDTCDSVHHTVATSLRRSLAFPLYRNWDLSCKVFSDVRCIIELGRVHVLKALLCVRDLLGKSSSRYILNNIIVDDYCCWIQSWTENSAAKKLGSLAQHLAKVPLVREITAWELGEMERLGRLEVEGEEEGEAMDDLDVARHMAEAESSSEEEEEESEEESSNEEGSEGEEGVGGRVDAFRGIVKIGKEVVPASVGEDLDLGRAQLGDLRLAEEEEEESSGRGRSSDTIELRPGRGTAQRGDVMEAASDDSDPVRFLGGAVGTRREDKMFAKMGGMRSSSPRSESAGRGGWGFDQDDGVVELGLHRDGLMQGASQARSSEEAEESSELWPTRPVPSPQRPMKGLIEVMSQEDYQEAKARMENRKRMELMSMPSTVAWFRPGLAPAKSDMVPGGIASMAMSGHACGSARTASHKQPRYGGLLE